MIQPQGECPEWGCMCGGDCRGAENSRRGRVFHNEFSEGKSIENKIVSRRLSGFVF
jgi:hypothetical protein